MKLPVSIVVCVLTAALPAIAADASLRQTQLEDLGRALFFDVNLSRDRTQSCATCHDPARAFADWRDNGVGAAASMGGDLKSLGDRNAPTASYAAAIPPFSRKPDGDYMGGLFWDGRADTLEDQAGGPPLNPIEMAMPDKATVVARLQENANYQHAFKGLFGDDIFTKIDAAFAGMTQAIAAVERTPFFSPFDSKYDRYLAGTYKPTELEDLGMTLFFSNQFTNCSKCHRLNEFPGAKNETFSNYTFQNIGVPANTSLREHNGKGATYIDHGLTDHTGTADKTQDGKFRTSSLRNVAITAPYMHNGVFKDLRTVIKFYNKYLAKGSKAQINPETGKEWGKPEVADNIALEKLQSGRALTEHDIDALVAFLKMLTDKRYEVLLEAQQ